MWITKYRYKVLLGEAAERTRELIRQICQAREVTIVRGAVSPDHVHMLVSVPPQLAPAKLVQYVKGRSSRRLREKGTRKGDNARFYEACGFVVEGRSELDDTGRPYPLLHLRLAAPRSQS